MTCLANTPYVMPKFRTSEKGIRRVDYIASLAGEVEVNVRLDKLPKYTYTLMAPYAARRRVCI
jgi:hypothetical protein